MILLEKLLAGLEVQVRTFAICSIERGAALPLAATDLPTVHYSLTGSGSVQLGKAPPIAFGRHSVIIMPPAMPMVVRADGDPSHRGPLVRRCEPLSDGLVHLKSGAEAPAVVLACGRITATYQKAAGLFDHLSEPLIDDFACEDGICRPFETLLAELAAPRPGTLSLADSLMQQCLVLILRRYCASGECRLPWLSALEDPRLNRAVAEMLAHPERDFSLEGLAELAGMSRSAFAAHFAAAFERTPMELLKEMRLRRAAQLLRSTDLPVKSVAPRVGYDSRSYFSRAFKAFYGVDPAAYRRGEAAEDADRNAG